MRAKVHVKSQNERGTLRVAHVAASNGKREREREREARQKRLLLLHEGT